MCSLDGSQHVACCASECAIKTLALTAFMPPFAMDLTLQAVHATVHATLRTTASAMLVLGAALSSTFPSRQSCKVECMSSLSCSPRSNHSDGVCCHFLHVTCQTCNNQGCGMHQVQAQEACRGPLSHHPQRNQCAPKH